MWTKILHFKKLTGDEIDVNDLASDTAWIGVLRGGILINDAVTTSILKADAITSKHTITGATFQTVTTASRGVKIDSTNGLRSWDTGGNLRLQVNNSGANFTGSVTSGFGVRKATMTDNVLGNGSGMIFDTGNGEANQPLITAFSGTPPRGR